ncbi:hypothetical protein D1BOALGB6SA_10204 [Olavius sp. associated proteobacterium Delta 1]|nr:hypothetical protein D1BOALGB6SA_10204 [Olavius sp. associated proteobacterium Delta 1]
MKIKYQNTDFVINSEFRDSGIQGFKIGIVQCLIPQFLNP